MNKKLIVLVIITLLIFLIVEAYILGIGPFYHAPNDGCDIISTNEPFFIRTKWSSYDEAPGCGYV